MDAKQITSAIISNTWTNEELNTMVEAIRFARSGLTKTVARTLQVGTRVRYESSRQGCMVDGEITKVALKYATVRSNGQLWKVPMNMLTVA